MSRLPSSTLMSALTIPGTHDSAAYTYSWPFIATQTLDIAAQLNAGIRYFDLRCGLRHDVLEMVHGQALLNLRLETVLATMYAWLATHPSEALIAQIKRDRKDDSSTLHFAQAVVHLLSAAPDSWRTAATTPLLGDLRSRIQLFRRFDTHPSSAIQPLGIDVSHWPDNPIHPFTITTLQNVSLTIQDHYSFASSLSLPALITAKGLDVSELLQTASSSPNDSHWFLNFTSAFEFNLYYQITPREIAAGAYWAFRWEEGMNVRLAAWLEAQRDDCVALGKSAKRRYGIVAMDFPEAGARDLVMSVVRTNFEKKGGKRRKGKRWLGWWLVNAVLLVGVLILMFGWTAVGRGFCPMVVCGSGVEVIAEPCEGVLVSQ
jgi:1-phosphatidylinositol phosphodiesterase